MDNFLPDCQAQIHSGVGHIPKMKADGSGPQPPIFCTGFTPVQGNSPTFFASNTGELKVGDLVTINEGGVFWGWTGVGYPSTAGGAYLTAVRVIAVTPTSFTVGPCPLVGVAPAVSGICTAQAIGIGDLGLRFRTCDGWNKTPSLCYWADDFPVNSCPGAIRTFGLRKGVATTEQLYWQCPQTELPRYLGRTITFGVIVKGNITNWVPWIYDNIAGYDPATMTAIPMPNGSNFLCVTATPTVGATDFRIGINLDGNVGDVFYAALPTAGFAVSMIPNDCGQNSNEQIRSLCHYNPPLLTPLNMGFPIAAYPNTNGQLFGYAGIDLEAISLGACHASVSAVRCKIEFNFVKQMPAGNLIDVTFLTMSEMSLPRGTANFGPETMQNKTSDSGLLLLTQNGTFALCVGTSNVFVNATFDFDGAVLAMPSLSTVDT